MNNYAKSGLIFSILFFSFLLLISNNASAVNKLFNYLGSGSPRLHLELAEDNGPNWDSYSIDYKNSGNIPWSADSSMQWTPWNIKDEAGHYFGTVNLSSDGNVTTFDSYSYDSSSEYRLEGVTLSLIPNTKNYQLKAVIDAGSFPDTPQAKPAVYPGTTTPVVLSVSGSNIINDKGFPILIKGVVRPSLEWNVKGQFLSPQDIENMKLWGANAIRINLNQLYWFASGPISQKDSYKQILDAMIYHAIEQNMAVILDLHWVKEQGQSPMANRESIKFWEQVAAQYKDFGTVLFELYNEPVGIDKGTWLNGGAGYAGYQELVDAVRRVGANNICIVNGTDWGYDLSFVNSSFNVKGKNIVYGSHPYIDKGADGWTGPGGSFANNFAGVLGKYPLIFTEFGDNHLPDYASGKYKEVYERILKYIDQNNVSYAGFAWWVEKGNPAFPALISDWSGTPVYGGELIYKNIQQRPGTLINAH